jgi:hypothetical protein
MKLDSPLPWTLLYFTVFFIQDPGSRNVTNFTKIAQTFVSFIYVGLGISHVIHFAYIIIIY